MTLRCLASAFHPDDSGRKTVALLADRLAVLTAREDNPIPAIRTLVEGLYGDHDEEACTIETREEAGHCLCGADDYNEALSAVLAGISVIETRITRKARAR